MTEPGFAKKARALARRVEAYRSPRSEQGSEEYEAMMEALDNFWSVCQPWQARAEYDEE